MKVRFSRALRLGLAGLIDPASRVSEVLNCKRPLSIGMIRALHRGLGIPAQVFLEEVPG